MLPVLMILFDLFLYYSRIHYQLSLCKLIVPNVVYWLCFSILNCSYLCPGPIAMTAFLQASRFCASSVSSWCSFISLRTCPSTSVWAFLEVSSLPHSSLLLTLQHSYRTRSQLKLIDFRLDCVLYWTLTSVYKCTL